ncbi:hypothetical protein [Thermogemmatispora aurantia]|uniref:hypothetical protein n=1 Tax=Thermogemmatispora aurantia TaxID=2045279 RepID=UPI00124C6DC9|nr:hypothetical protein [Thermogemmatispora aurantia]
MRRKDAATLIGTGIAFNLRPLGNLRTNQEQAVACSRAALEVYTHQQMPFEWASTQYNLALTYLDLGEALAAWDQQATCTALRKG